MFNPSLTEGHPDRVRFGNITKKTSVAIIIQNFVYIGLHFCGTDAHQQITKLCGDLSFLLRTDKLLAICMHPFEVP